MEQAAGSADQGVAQAGRGDVRSRPARRAGPVARPVPAPAGAAAGASAAADDVIDAEYVEK